MTPYFQNARVTLYHGNACEVMPEIKGCTAIVTDPPYELGFMGKSWDKTKVGFDLNTWFIALGCCLPGAHLLAFGGSRTFHRIASAIENAGWEIRDTLLWLYGSGFPKSLDVSKAIDKAAGAEREVVGIREDFAARANKTQGDNWLNGIQKPDGFGVITTPSTDAAKLWNGYGTALKPAFEPIILARKPLIGTVVQKRHGARVRGVEY